MADNRKQGSVLDPQLLAATHRLELTARRLVAGATTGLHASQRPGLAREFSQYRAYQPGDDARHIDWKLFARSDRVFLRESEVDTRVTISLVLDATASMSHPAGASGGPRKFDLARSMAAALAYLAERQGDEVTLHVVSEGGVSTVVTAGHRQPFRRIVHALAAVEPAGRWPSDPGRLAHALRRVDLAAGSTAPAGTCRLTVLLTDGHQPDGEIRAALLPLRARNHELVFFNFVAPDERDFPFRGAVRLEEWETGRTLEADATALRPAYLAAREREREAWRQDWGRDHFEYLELMTDASLAQGLRTFLRRRQQR